MNKKLLCCLAATLITTSTMAEQKTISLRIIETTDVHGSFFPYDYIAKQPTSGSMARVSTLVNQLRKQYGDNLILLDNGDILQGQPSCYYSNYIDSLNHNVVADIVNYMHFDAVTLGNHDIETGHKVYDKWISEMQCPTIAANVINKVTDKTYTKPYIILERNGVKIAVLGMLTPAIPNWLKEPLWSGMRFENIKESTEKWVKVLKEQEHADVIVGLFHSGWNGGIVTPDYNEDDAERVAHEVDGLDILFFGHDHIRHESVETNTAGNRIVCLNPANKALAVGDASVEITIDNGQIMDKKVSGKLTDVKDLPIDEQYMANFADFTKRVENFVGEYVGEIKETMYTRDAFFGSSPFIDLIHNLQLSITGADISFNAPLSFDSKVEKGSLYMSDMFKLYKYENQIYVMELTGEEVRRHLEMSYDLWVNTMKTADDHILLLDSKKVGDTQRMGFKNMTFNFDSAAGIDYEVDVTKPNSEKVKILQMSNGEKFDPNKTYKVVINSYRGNGGGELLTAGAGIPRDSLQSRIIFESEKDQRYYFTKEIQKLKTITPKANNNWRFVPEAWTKPAIERDRQLLFH